MGVFSNVAKKIKEAQTMSNRVKPELGSYRLRINSIVGKRDRKEVPQICFSADILTSTSVHPMMQPGRQFETMWYSTGDYFWSHVKKFMCQLLNASEAELNAMEDTELAELLDGLTEEKQIAAGWIIDAEVVSYVSKKGPNAGKTSNVVDFLTAPMGSWSPEQKEFLG
jgi:hypothetical protein